MYTTFRDVSFISSQRNVRDCKLPQMRIASTSSHVAYFNIFAHSHTHAYYAVNILASPTTCDDSQIDISNPAKDFLLVSVFLMGQNKVPTKNQS